MQACQLTITNMCFRVQVGMVTVVVKKCQLSGGRKLPVLFGRVRITGSAPDLKEVYRQKILSISESQCVCVCVRVCVCVCVCEGSKSQWGRGRDSEWVRKRKREGREREREREREKERERERDRLTLEGGELWEFSCCYKIRGTDFQELEITS